MTINEMKRRRGVPCLAMIWNEKKQCDELCAPAIDCGLDCDTCGFNPYEAERRFKEGHYVQHGVVKTLVFKPMKGAKYFERKE